MAGTQAFSPVPRVFSPIPRGLGDPLFRCRNCGADTAARPGDFYMLRDEIWAATGLGPVDGMLCLDCAETRLGRPLEVDDFDLGDPWYRQANAPALRRLADEATPRGERSADLL